MKRYLTILAAILLCLSSASFAHDETFDTQNIDSWDGVYLEHQDSGEYKGFATITVINTMAEDWGDFHIAIVSWDETNSVFFDSTQQPSISVPLDSYNGLTYSNDNDYGPTKINFNFKENPIAPGDPLTITVYTDNTNGQNDWFGLQFWPTPVPEPATITLLGIGGFLFASRKQKK